MVDLQTTPKDKYEDLRTQWAERLDVESDVVFLSCNYQRRKENKRDAYFEEQALQSLVKMIEYVLCLLSFCDLTPVGFPRKELIIALRAMGRRC